MNHCQTLLVMYICYVKHLEIKIKEMAMKETQPEFNPNNYFVGKDEKGMTISSASKLANLAKERNREDQLFIDNLKFYNNEMSLLVSPNEKVTLSEGLAGTPDEFAKIKEALSRIARYNAFIAWIREAIEAKEDLKMDVQGSILSEWCEQKGISYPKKPENRIEEDLEGKQSSKSATMEEMAQYFIAQSKASTLGQAIHPSGAIEIARREVIEAEITPSVREGVGKDTVIFTKNLTASKESVNDFYMELQADWRHAESKVNEANGEWKSKDDITRIELLNIYNAKVRDYENETSRIKADWEKWKLEEIRRIGKLKIRIPYALQPVLDELLALGK